MCSLIPQAAIIWRETSGCSPWLPSAPPALGASPGRGVAQPTLPIPGQFGAQGYFSPQLQAAKAWGSLEPWVYPTLRPCLFPSPVPIDSTQGLKMLYVFVDIKIDASHFLETIRFNFTAGTSLALVSTIQFVSTVQVRDGDPWLLSPPEFSPGSALGAAAPGCWWSRFPSDESPQ